MPFDPHPRYAARVFLPLPLPEAAEWVSDWFHTRATRRLRLVARGARPEHLPPDILAHALYTEADGLDPPDGPPALLCIVTPAGDQLSAILFRELGPAMNWAPPCIHFLVRFTAPAARDWFTDLWADAAAVARIAASARSDAPRAAWGGFANAPFDLDADAPPARAVDPDPWDAAAPRPEARPSPATVDEWRARWPFIEEHVAAGKPSAWIERWLDTEHPDLACSAKTITRMRHFARDGGLGHRQT